MPAAGRGRAGEGDLVDTGVADQKLGDLAVGGDDVEDAGRQADVLGDLGEEVGVARRLRRGLEDDGAPGEQRRRDLVGDEAEGCVPRDDRPDHADRLADEQAELTTHGGLHLLLEGEGRGQARVVVEDTCHPARRVLGDGEEGAGLTRPQLARLLALAPQALGDRPQVLSPLGMGQPRPRALVKSLTGGVDCPGHVGLPGFGHAEIQLLGGRIDDLDDVGGGGLDPLPADEEAVVVADRYGCARHGSHSSCVVSLRRRD